MSLPDQTALLLSLVALAFGPLVERVVFVGGTVTPLLIADEAAIDVRPTYDVDVVVEVASRGDYHALEDELRRRGFVNDASEGAPICRWTVEGTPVDVMPTDPNIFGFSNRWHPYALTSAVPLRLPQVTLYHADAVAFVATKLEAFQSPTRPLAGDVHASHDLEDVLAVVDGHPAFPDGVADARPDVRDFIAASFRTWLADDNFRDAVPGHLEQGPTNAGRTRIVLGRLNQIAALAGS